jgi:hypothetical protein
MLKKVKYNQTQVVKHDFWNNYDCHTVVFSFFSSLDLHGLKPVSKQMHQYIQKNIKQKREKLKCIRGGEIDRLTSSAVISWKHSRKQYLLNHKSIDARVFFIQIMRCHFRVKNEKRQFIQAYAPLVNNLVATISTRSQQEIQSFKDGDRSLLNAFIQWLDLVFFNFSRSELQNFENTITQLLRLSRLYKVKLKSGEVLMKKAIYLLKRQYCRCKVDEMLFYALRLLDLEKYHQQGAKLLLNEVEVDELCLFLLFTNSMHRQTQAITFFNCFLRNCDYAGLRQLLLNCIRFSGVSYIKRFFEYIKKQKIDMEMFKITELFYLSFNVTNGYNYASFTQLEDMLSLLLRHGLDLSTSSYHKNKLLKLVVEKKYCRWVSVLLSGCSVDLDLEFGDASIKNAILDNGFCSSVTSVKERQDIENWLNYQVVQHESREEAVQALLGLSAGNRPA